MAESISAAPLANARDDPHRSTHRQPSLSVALCIVGVANHHMSGKKEKPAVHAHPVYDERTYGGLLRWITRLGELGVDSSVFLVLDLATGWRANNGHPSRPHQANPAMHHGKAAGSAAWRAEHNRTSTGTMQPMLDALRPERFVEYDQPPHCTGQPCACSIAGSSIWWRASTGSSRSLLRAA
jgi:hypothetical protein